MGGMGQSSSQPGGLFQAMMMRKLMDINWLPALMMSNMMNGQSGSSGGMGMLPMMYFGQMF